MVVGEPAGQGFAQVGGLVLELAAGQGGQGGGVAFPGDQGVQDRPAGDAEQVGDALVLVGDLQAGVLQDFADALAVGGAVLGQGAAHPGQVPQLAHRRRGHEGRAQHPALGQFGQPDRIELVGLGPARHVLHVPGVHQPHPQPAVLQQVEERPPVVPGGLHHHQFHALAHQVVAQGDDVLRGRRHRPGPLHPPARIRPGRPPGAHHRRGLGDIDRRNPGHVLGLLLQLHDLGIHDMPPPGNTPRPKPQDRREDRTGNAEGLIGVVGSPRAFQPGAPTEPCVTVARYTALVVLVTRRRGPCSPRPSGRRTSAAASRPSPTAFGPSCGSAAVCTSYGTTASSRR